MINSVKKINIKITKKKQSPKIKKMRKKNKEEIK